MITLKFLKFRQSITKFFENILYFNNETRDKCKQLIQIETQKEVQNKFLLIEQEVKQIKELSLINGYKQNRQLYLSAINSIYKRVCSKGKIRVAFLVIYSSSFSAFPIYEAMLKDDMFEPFIIVIPDTFRGEKNMFLQMEKAVKFFSEKYANVKQSYNKDTNKFIDFSDSMDIACLANPYDFMTDNIYSLKYLVLKNILTFYIPYGWYGLTKYNLKVIKDEFHNSVWKIFLESNGTRDELSKEMYNLGANIVVSGYCKMDALANIKPVLRHRKRIIISPHHTILDLKEELNISNFLKYYEFFVELPRNYPDVDFVFRPHPLLFVKLAKSDIWGEGKVKKYLEDLTKNPNVIYDTSSDYLDLFVNSDAMIHDCGSFKAEYMYTDHPQCYLINDDANVDKNFSEFGKEILKYTYISYCQQDILNFIDNVVIKGDDVMKKDRINFANKYIKINYPFASSKIMKILKKELGLL
jgi:SAM-dependent methyltransferase